MANIYPYVGSWRNIFFDVSTIGHMRILSFSDMNRTAGSTWATHPALGGLERVEKTGDKLETLSFQMLFRTDLGVIPRVMIDLLHVYLKDGMASPLILGNYPIGYCNWVLTDLRTEYKIILCRGQIFSAAANVTLKQYN